MSNPRNEKFRAVVAAVNEVLYNEWAPIGFIDGLPKNEYESYAIRIVSMLAAGTDANKLAAYLAETGSAISGHAATQSSSLPVAQRSACFAKEAGEIAL
ncbi:hypothetical protein ACFONG_04690 [Uliginosibacterium paludis]|uniref:DUF1737 domain-containing protein n=1 Tax=Uliginosibacterium paludis TaxID=1615952 RepID=A0ABV2CN37_9RHOO